MSLQEKKIKSAIQCFFIYKKMLVTSAFIFLQSYGVPIAKKRSFFLLRKIEFSLF